MSISRRHFLQSALAGTAVLTLPEVFAQDIESTMARVKRTGKLRLGAINGAIPYFNKDLVTQEWKGFCADFGRDLARYLKAEVEWVETTWGNAVLDVQTNKIDAQLAMAPTPQRREVVDFSNPLYNNINTVVARKGLEFKAWEDLNKPEIKVAVDVGSSHDQLVTRILPKATILRFETSAAATMALQSGRAERHPDPCSREHPQPNSLCRWRVGYHPDAHRRGSAHPAKFECANHGQGLP